MLHFSILHDMPGHTGSGDSSPCMGQGHPLWKLMSIRCLLLYFVHFKF